MTRFSKIFALTIAALFVVVLTSCSPNAKTLFEQGCKYHDGIGVPVNKQKAIECWKKAGELGLPEAQFIVGCIYEGGLDVDQDMAEAEKWFRKAAEQGYEPAIEALKDFDEQNDD